MKIREVRKNKKGITLIALVITIIILLILAGISTRLVVGENGLMKKAIDSKEKSKLGRVQEEITLWENSKKINNMTEIANVESANDLIDRLQRENCITDEEAEKLKNGETIQIANTDITIIDDEINNKEEIMAVDVVQQGDFIEYNAGVWKETEINQLKANGHYVNGELPDKEFTFGGFIAGSNRNYSIDAYSNSHITQDPRFSKGWKVLSNKNGVIKIISAGTVEAYKHSQYSEIDGFYSGGISEYILRNAKPYNDKVHTLEDYLNLDIIPRDFTMYENNLAVPNSARCCDIYDCYYVDNSINSSEDPLKNLGIFYHIASMQENTALGRVEPSGSVYMSANTCYGIRIVLTLKSNIVITSNNTGDGSTYEKSWKIKLK